MLARSVALDLWALAKPVLAIVALLVILRLLVLREPLANGWMLLAAVLLTIVGAITSAGRLTEPGTGILFTVPVGLIVGLEYLTTGGVGT